MNARYARGAVPVSTLAALSIAVLLGALGAQLGSYYAPAANVRTLAYERARDERGAILVHNDSWQEELRALGIVGTSTEAATESTATPSASDRVASALLAEYAHLKSRGVYSRLSSAAAGRAIGASIRTPVDTTHFTASDVRRDPDTSTMRVLAYRTDMREALTPIATPTEPELTTFARYIETNDPGELLAIEAAAKRHQAAAEAAASVVVPEDAASIHLRATNALYAYGDMLRQFIRTVDDAFGTLAVLATYNEAEQELLYAFDALAKYYARKTTQ